MRYARYLKTSFLVAQGNCNNQSEKEQAPAPNSNPARWTCLSDCGKPAYIIVQLIAKPDTRKWEENS